METRTVNAGLVTRIVPQLERFINRQILGIEPDPDHWPAPPDLGSLAIPAGTFLSDDAGQTLILGCEYSSGWPRRRTVIGAQAFRFENNHEYDCGWRLCDVAARFIRRHASDDFNLLTIVPPADTYGQLRSLPWLAGRVAKSMEIPYLPDVFESVGPLAVHPDALRRPTIPLTELFRVADSHAPRLKNSRVLLIDWRRHSGRTLLTLTRMLCGKGAAVVRFAWLG